MIRTRCPGLVSVVCVEDGAYGKQERHKLSFLSMIIVTAAEGLIKSSFQTHIRFVVSDSLITYCHYDRRCPL